MALTTLGKRTRSSNESDLTPGHDSPAKRTRRSRRNLSGTEATAPSLSIDDIENQENREPSPDSQEDAAEPTPTKSRPRRVAVNAVKSPSVAPVTPSTPRHYDVFARGTTTPRHRVMSAGRLSKRATPQTPLTPNTLQTVYHQARQLFSRSADPGQLIGRDDERAKLEAFLERCKTSRPSGCLYVSGPPGTGKSAMVNKITDEIASTSSSIRKASINCMSIKSSKDLYITLLDQLGCDIDVSESDVVEALQKLFFRNKATADVFLVVLDEIDHILTLDSGSLYRMFEWSLQPNSRLTMVGIANALDLTDRFLPRLKSRNLKPELLPFLPYTAPQVKRIITTRLKSLVPEGATAADFIPFFHPAAIELCSRKVSSQTGDLRRAFEICRRALDLVESETRMKQENEIKEQLLQMSPSRKVLGEKRNPASASPLLQRTPGAGPSVAASLAKSLQSLTIESAPRVTIAHLNKVTAAAFSNGAAQRLKTLNLQQKAALCALVAIEKRNRTAAAAAAAAATATATTRVQTPTPSSSSPSTPTTTPRAARGAPAAAPVSAPTIKTLYEAYCRLCTQDAVLHPLSSSEFREVVDSLETLSLVAPVDLRRRRGGSLFGPGQRTPTSAGAGRRGRKKDVFAFGGGCCGGGGGGGGIAGAGVVGGGDVFLVDERRVASCVGEREMEAAIEGMGAGILTSILSGEALD